MKRKLKTKPCCIALLSAAVLIGSAAFANLAGMAWWYAAFAIPTLGCATLGAGLLLTEGVGLFVEHESAVNELVQELVAIVQELAQDLLGLLYERRYLLMES